MSIPGLGRPPGEATQPIFLGFLGGSDGNESTCNVGDLGSVPGLGRSPGGGQGNLFQYSCLESPHGQRSLADYSPWGRKDSDMTKNSTVQFIRGENLYKYSPRNGSVFPLIQITEFEL